MDSHGDTCCAGANLCMTSPTGDTCDVAPYDDTYELRKKLTIGTCAAVFTTPDGIDFILIGHDMIYVGHILPHSLINPNQIRHFGASVQNDYTRSYEAFGIILDNLFIPFQMQCTITHFESRIPSPNKLDSLLHAVFTSNIE